jgi:hypothetical protein
MKNTEILKQAADILTKTETMVEHAHKLLRNDQIDQQQFVEIKRLEMKAQQLYRSLDNENR